MLSPKLRIKLRGMVMDIGKQIGRRIKLAREARGLTQVHLADLLGKSVETISNFERGKVVTSLVTLNQLARHLKIPVKAFFDDEVPVSSPTESLSEAATTLRNAVVLLPEDDLEVLAGLADVLKARRWRKRS